MELSVGQDGGGFEEELSQPVFHEVMHALEIPSYLDIFRYCFLTR
jgi:hypothetical protein